MPLVSVCIATYNGEKFIREQLDSILCQLSANDEVIISDDGSTDNTRSIILSYCDPRIKLFENKTLNLTRNQLTIYRVTRNFENALRNASGDIIFLSDQDDVWERTKVQEVLPLFESQNTALVVHDAVLMNDGHQIIADSYFQMLKSRPGLLKNIVKNSYLGCCMAFNKKVLEKSLPFPPNLIAHDIWIGLIAERTGNVVFTGKKLIRYQRHESTVTTSGEKSKHGILFKISYRLQFLIQYFSRIFLITTTRNKSIFQR